MSMDVLSTGVWVAIALVLSAFIGKIVGVLVPGLLSRLGFLKSTILGLSMVPRAEIAMVIVAKGASLGP